MFRFLTVLIGLVLAAPAFAQNKEKDKPKPNTLTPQEIAEGWLLLFDGETTFGWSIDGAAEVKDGSWILGRGQKTIAVLRPFVGRDFEVQFEWQGTGSFFAGSAAVTFGPNRAADQKMWGTLDYSHQPRGGEAVSVRGGDSVSHLGKPAHQKLAATSLVIETDGQTPAVLRSVKLRPLGASALFNGKNLDGWKVNAADPKRMASKWEVTNNGELWVKDGPGDLLTEKQFDNFLLQFECQTSGDALNSGIFFRCVPGQYQNGYEAQIQNAYRDNDRTKPKDFGTGAIYRRVPARKVVSNDKEWFTMTVVANGKHFATWVNGYQVVDWIDNRPDNENPRVGYRAAKGPLSIQGHDPTTDILFRNIRIVELPK